MKNFLKLLTLSAFSFFIANDAEASTYGYVTTYSNEFLGTTYTTTYGSIGNESIYLNTTSNNFLGNTYSNTYGNIGSSSVYANTYGSNFLGNTSSNTYFYID